FIFKADRNNKDFYIFLWEGHDTCVSSWRPKSYNGYNMLTGNITGKYTHTKAEAAYRPYMYPTDMSTIGVSNCYSGMTLSSSQMSRYNNLRNNIGWGTKHYKVYRVTNGVMKEVKPTYYGDGQGWKQDWFNMNMKNSVKIRSTGREVKIYIQSYRQGKYNPNNYKLAVKLNVAASRSKGSVGLAIFSQSIQYEKIAVTRWENVSGRIPEDTSKWSKYKDPGTKQISAKGSSYV